jgi:hypothetical protein
VPAAVVLFVILAVGVGSAAGVSSGSSGSSGRSALRPANGWCEARPNGAWRSALANGVVGLSRKASIVPLAADGDGRSFFATIHTPSFSGVARINAHTGRVTRIKRFPDPAKDQAWGSFDGRWLLWFEGHSFYNLGDFTVFAWDSRTARVVKIGAGWQESQGRFRWSSWRHPYVRNGVATWEQASGPNRRGDVHVFDLATGRDRIVRHGYAHGPILVGDRLVVWPESARLHGPTRMHAADARTGRPATVPLAVRGLRGIPAATFITDGGAIVYAADSFRSLWWSPSPSVLPMRLVRVGYADNVDNSLQVAGRYVFFSISPYAYLADTVTRRYIEVSGGGLGLVNDKALVLVPPSNRKAIHLITDVMFLPLASLPPIPRCR